jgi:hypothetical protein
MVEFRLFCGGRRAEVMAGYLPITRPTSFQLSLHLRFFTDTDIYFGVGPE